MAMTMRERILSVYKGEKPDIMPFMLDISHWLYHRYNMPWDLSVGCEKIEKELIDYHKKNRIGFYLVNRASLYSIKYRDDVVVSVKKSYSDGVPVITWKYDTPYGSIQRSRIWEEASYSWAIKEWGIKSEEDLKILGYIFSNVQYIQHPGRYESWVSDVADSGVVYIQVGYSGIGQLLNYWMGIEGTTYAIYDWPDTVKEVVDTINDSILSNLDKVLEIPGEVIFMGDNFSSDIQPPSFFNTWSAPFYKKAVKMIHDAGKYVAVHTDGKLRGTLKMIRDVGADCADAVTPKPMGDLTPDECRTEAGNDFILSGGVSPDVWLPSVNIDIFKEAVMEWIELKKRSHRIIAAAGDQVPPGAEEKRIMIMRDMVEQYGKY
jgi:hypothetical protein